MVTQVMNAYWLRGVVELGRHSYGSWIARV
jgi:hypothetical protein